MIVRTIVAAFLLAATSLPAIAGQKYEMADPDALACSDRKIAVEINDASKHPGTLSDQHFGRLFDEGHCSPVFVPFEIVRFETLTIPTGRKRIAVGRLRANGITETFYVPADSVRKVTATAP